MDQALERLERRHAAEVGDAQNAVLAPGRAPAGATVFADEAALEAWLEARPAVIVLDDSRLALPLIFICGAIAISAMILPGLSGAFLLLFLGQYHAVLSAIHGVVDGALGLLGGAADFAQLAPGDYLVHTLHGVGLYQGLAKLPLDGTPIDFLHLEYDGGTLYLPVYRMGEVQRYVGAEGIKPRVDKLGGVSFEKSRRNILGWFAKREKKLWAMPTPVRIMSARRIVGR